MLFLNLRHRVLPRVVNLNGRRYYGRRGCLAIQTLNPEKLSASDSLDLTTTAKRISTLRVGPPDEQKTCSLVYSVARPRGSYMRVTPFPSDARGFLYSHPPTSDVYYPSMGHFDDIHLRFRIVPDSDPAHFSSGTDLRTPDGTVWHMDGGRLAFRPCYRPLADMLLRDGLITQSDIARWASTRIEKTPYFINGPELTSLSRPFVFDLTHRFKSMKLNSPSFSGPSYQYAITNPFIEFESRGKEALWYSKGLLACRFEPHSKTKDGKVESLAVRIHSVLVPPEPKDIVPVGFNPQFVPGKLLTRSSRDRKGMIVWTFNLRHKNRKALAAAVDACWFDESAAAKQQVNTA